MERRSLALIILVLMLISLIPIVAKSGSVESPSSGAPASPSTGEQQWDSYAKAHSSDAAPPEFLYVNGFDNTKKGWTKTGASPYLDAIDYPTNYIAGITDGHETGYYSFADLPLYFGEKIFIEIYAKATDVNGADDIVQIWVYNVDTASYVKAGNTTTFLIASWGWKSLDVSSVLNTAARINGAKAYLVKYTGGSLGGTVQVDAMRLRRDIALSNAHDMNLASYTAFNYSSRPAGYGKGLELYDYNSTIEWPALTFGSPPSISSVDFHIRYNASENRAGTPDDKYRIVYYVSSTPVAAGDTTKNVTLVDWRNDFVSYLYVNGLDNSKTGWARIGYNPYLNATDSSYIYVTNTTVRPSADTAIKQWTIGAGSGTSHYNKVNEVVPDNMTTYLYATANNQNESFALSDITPAPSWVIEKVRLNVLAAQGAQGGDEQVVPALWIGGNRYGGKSFTPYLQYVPMTGAFLSEWERNPRYNIPWNWTAINSLEAGFYSNQTGLTWDHPVNVTQVYLQIFVQPEIGYFDFQDLAAGYPVQKVFLEIYANQSHGGDDSVELFLWDDTIGSYVSIDTVRPPETSSWIRSSDAIPLAHINTTSRINIAKAYLAQRVVGNKDDRININAMRLVIFNAGFYGEPTILNFENKPKPGGGAWNWTDINNIRFAVEYNVVGAPDPGGEFKEYEAYVTVHIPKSKVVVTPSSVSALSPGSTLNVYVNSTGVLDLVTYQFGLSYNQTGLALASVSSVSPFTQKWSLFDGQTLYVNGYDSTKTGWTRTGVSPYLSAIDYPNNYVSTSTSLAQVGDFSFNDAASYAGGNVYVEVYSRMAAADTDDYAEVWVYNVDTASYFNAGNIVPASTTPAWKTLNVTSQLNTLSRINGAKAYLVKRNVSTANIMIVDAMRLRVDTGLMTLSYSMPLSPAPPKMGTIGNPNMTVVTFKVLKAGTYAFDIHDSVLSSSKGAPLPHDIIDNDVEVTAVTPRGGWTRAYQGYPRNITVTVQSKITVTYNVTVNAYYGASLLGNKNLTNFAPGASTTFDLIWVTTSVPYGDYEIIVIASLTENDVSSLNAGVFRLTIIGDANGDKAINVLDILAVKSRWGRTPASPDWILDYDVNCDNTINVLDILTVKAHWGQSW